MEKQFSDEQIDRVMARLVQPDDELVDQIADSPQLWWAVQTNVAQEKETELSPWPPIQKIWRWLAIAAPVAAGLVITVIWLAGSSRVEQPVALNEVPVVEGTTMLAVDTPGADQSISGDQETSDGVTRNIAPVIPQKTTRAAQKTFTKSVAKRETQKPVEIKTDFIALTYAQAPASGQVVRVKVPSAMMVSLGLVETVERPTRLVDAEVVLGDDGMTHAIRFIRNQ